MAAKRRSVYPQLTFIADDYGLSPGVCLAIRELISAGKLSGTGCMTLFAEWQSEAVKLKALCNEGEAEAGLHLTLTDFEPLSGAGPLGNGKLPPLGKLIRASSLGRVNADAVEAELDAQLDAFTQVFGQYPHFLDGHQHVHFLPAVRGWMKKRFGDFSQAGQIPWLRGGPSFAALTGVNLRLKTAIVALLARGFDAEMSKAGFHLKGPLVGFYDWNRPDGFKPMLARLEQAAFGKAVVMCHPGFPDELLRARDRLIEARSAEFATLMEFEQKRGWRT
jgi:chitin disaccharide deacetylase